MKNHGQIWTDEDNANLRALYEADTPMPKIMKELGRTKHAIYRQAAVIGARRSADFMRRMEQMKAEADARVREIGAVKSRAEILESLGISPITNAKLKDKPEPAPEPKKKSLWYWLLGK